MLELIILYYKSKRRNSNRRNIFVFFVFCFFYAFSIYNIYDSRAEISESRSYSRYLYSYSFDGEWESNKRIR